MKTHTILFLAANPSGTDSAALAREARSIQEELRSSGYRDRFAFATWWATQPLDLLRKLLELKPAVVHFSGGGGQNGLFFQTADGRPKVVPTDALAEAFGAAGNSVKLVVLNACYSEVHAQALLAHVDCVVGMSGSIDTSAARSFAIGFYGGLGQLESVAAAYKQGRAAIKLEGLPDADRPQLRVRDGVDASKPLLALSAENRDEAPLPYEDVFVERLEQIRLHTLELARGVLGLAETDPEQVFRRRVARTMIEGGLEATVKALVSMGENISIKVVKELTILAESLWIDGRTAETASGLAESQLPHGLRWNATYDATALDLLRRACWHRRKGPPIWHHPKTCLIVHQSTGESCGYELVQEIAKQFEYSLNIKTPEEITARLANRYVAPVIAVVFAPVPPAEVLGELARSYPGLSVLFTDPGDERRCQDIIVTLPRVTVQRELEARAAAKAARENLMTFLDIEFQQKDSRL